jgi:hypothetical protein
MRKLLAALLLCFVPFAAFSQSQSAGENELDQPAVSEAEAMATARAAEAYWTAARMKAARPMPIPTLTLDREAVEAAADEVEEASPFRALPGYSPGWRPGSAPHKNVKYYIPVGHPMYPVTAAAADGFQPQHGTAPTNPKDGPYGPFQRYTEFDPITSYPRSTHGKLYFTLPGQGNFVCSATVIHRGTLITAGHCNAAGSGGPLATNRLFCPSHRNGVNSRGCWSVIASKTSAGWLNNGDPDYDYACLVTQTTGTTIANRIGNVTGWLGRSWNFAPSQAVRTFGYPQAAPFSGGRLETTQSTEWYSHNFTAGGQSSKIIGSDLTGGSSGGSWVLGWNNPGNEAADTDGSANTDPGNLWVSGVNSHKRCSINCSSPPTATTGVFWQEMTSPPFMNTAATDESEDIIGVCFANGGT